MITPISIEHLQNARKSSRVTANAKYASINEAKRQKVKTAFLCHSHKDRVLVEGLISFFAVKGIELYVDWKDEEMPPSPNRRTAERIQDKIGELDLFLYLATANSSNSKWCPWEIGYGDCKKGKHNLLIIPTKDGFVSYGQEYLELYNSIQLDVLTQRVYEFNPATGDSRLWTP